MREKIIKQMSLFDGPIFNLIPFVRREKILKKMDDVIEANPQIVNLVYADVTQNKIQTGRHGLSAEQVLRTSILRQLKGYSWRELAERLNDGICLRWFTRIYTANVPHHTSLQKAVHQISHNTWEAINDQIREFARKKKVENGRYMRADTTVTETDILYPVDARLLWDGVRVLTRIMEKIKEQLPSVDFGFANRTRSAKRLCYKIVMVKGRDADKRRRKLYRKLLKVSNDVFKMASRCIKVLDESPDPFIQTQLDQLDKFLTLAAVAISQCERRILNNEKVPVSHKIVSLFETHTDIICRGKTQSPAEFGHKVSFFTGKSGLITQYEVLEGNPADSDLFPGIIEKHKRQYGKMPFHVAMDRRYYSKANEDFAYEKGVRRVSVCKPGYQSKERRKLEKERWFKNLQKFRAGIEGIISGLMRGLGLKRCIWKGFDAFKRYVGISVVTFNIRKIALLL